MPWGTSGFSGMEFEDNCFRASSSGSQMVIATNSRPAVPSRGFQFCQVLCPKPDLTKGRQSSFVTPITLGLHDAGVLRVYVTPLSALVSGVTEDIRAPLRSQVLGSKPKYVLRVSQALGPQ
ncbi:hypothetical protein TNCV_3502071 [Trichonephila clavipes]|uniref:Uncharacterized protein n=1 Tax=Trichonephila clavipes TaxID=2585209 RepID=A0A8X6S0I9_TRICX|nr:hypothetical protein TNCV_3502071 [Trichonephila clavipes]